MYYFGFDYNVKKEEKEGCDKHCANFRKNSKEKKKGVSFNKSKHLQGDLSDEVQRKRLYKAYENDYLYWYAWMNSTSIIEVNEKIKAIRKVRTTPGTGTNILDQLGDWWN